MGIDLSRFKVVHGDKVFNAIALMEVHMPENVEWDKRDMVLKPKFIDILAINEDGNIISIHDEAWTFQFIPIVGEIARRQQDTKQVGQNVRVFYINIGLWVGFTHEPISMRERTVAADERICKGLLQVSSMEESQADSY